jgi:hypothetical protein
VQQLLTAIENMVLHLLHIELELQNKNVAMYKQNLSVP